MLIDILARRYGLKKISDLFDDEDLWETIRNPYRRALLVAIVSEVKTEEQVIAQILNEHMPQYIKNYIDISTCSIMNMLRSKGSQPIRTIFQETRQEKTEPSDTISIPIIPGKKVQRLR